MPVNYKLHTLTRQTKLGPDEILIRIGLSIQELLKLNNKTLREGEDWGRINFAVLESEYHITPNDLEIPDSLVHPHRQKLFEKPHHKVSLNDVLEIAMWRILAQLRHKHRPHPMSEQLINSISQQYDKVVNQFNEQQKIDIYCAHQDAETLLMDVVTIRDEEHIVELTNIFSREFARLLSGAFDNPLQPQLIRADEREIRHSALVHNSFFTSERPAGMPVATAKETNDSRRPGSPT